MNGLSICSGIGGIDLGLKLALGEDYRTVCYVEIEPFCQDVLLARMADGVLDRAPIWGDLRYLRAGQWRGLVDVVHGGYPCQPFSTASRGRRTAIDLWPYFHQAIWSSRPEYVFLENVNRSAFVRPERELRDIGYKLIGPMAFAAADVGAPHIRRRMFLLAYSDFCRKRQRPEYAEASEQPGGRTNPWESRLSRPRNGRVADGLPCRVDRLKALGNAVVPAVAALAWTTLMRQLDDARVSA